MKLYKDCQVSEKDLGAGGEGEGKEENFAVIVNNFTTEWFLWMVYYLVLVTIVIQSKA